MKAAVFTRYGRNDVVEVRDMPKPMPRSDEVLVRVYAAGVNPVDWKVREGQARIMTGSRFPKILGIEFAGAVVEAGSGTSIYRAGDPVLGTTGMKLGAFAEYVSVPVKRVFPKPENVTFEDASTVPIAGLTAIIALRDKGGISPGMKVLVNGAAGGVGMYAVQVAKIFGADVTAVCSAANAGLVKSLGADQVIDYHKRDFTADAGMYSIIFDAVSTRSFGECRRALTPRGVYVNTLPSPAIFLSIALTLLFPGKRAATVMASQNAADIAWICGHLAANRMRVVTDKAFTLDRVKDALAYSETGRAKGKIVLKCI